MKPIKHFVIIYVFFCEDGNAYNIRFTTSQYWKYIKELRRIMKSFDLHLVDHYEIFKNVRIVHEKRILSHIVL